MTDYVSSEAKEKLETSCGLYLPCIHRRTYRTGDSGWKCSARSGYYKLAEEDHWSDICGARSEFDAAYISCADALGPYRVDTLCERHARRFAGLHGLELPTHIDAS